MKSPFTASVSRVLMCAIALAWATGCSVSTAHLTDLTITKDDGGKTVASTFARTDTIYGQSGVANIPSPVTLQWHLIAENVAGQKPNTPIPTLDVSKDLSSDGTSTYTISPPTAGWPLGTYKVVVDMMVDSQQKDQKTAEFTVQ